MRPSRSILTISMMSVASAALFGANLLPLGVPVAEAASSVVTLPYVAGSTLDPIDWTGSSILPDQGSIFEGLYGYNKANQPVPAIATKAVPSDGGLVWTIYMRKNARWSNGKPVTAQDFDYAWLRAMSPTDNAGAMWAGIENDILNAYAYHAGAVPASKVGIDVVNNYELKLTLDGATNITGLLALAASMPLYPPSVEAHPTDWFMPQYFVGDGPYIVHSFVLNGDLDLTRNKNYVGPVGNVQQVDLIPYPSVPVEDYQSGALDMAVIGSASDYTYAKEHYKDQIHRKPNASVNYLGYDHSILPSALDNQLVREAIAMAINRAPIANPVLDGMVGATSVFGYPGFPTYSEEHNPYSYNVAAARKLLAKAGYPGGKGIGQLYLYTYTTAVNGQDVLMAEAVAQELKTNLGLNFKIMPTNSSEQGNLIWGGLVKGILPGYSIDVGTANWNQPEQWPLQSDQWVALQDSGDIPAPGNFQQYSANWNFYNYDPVEVKAWGNPSNPREGTSYAQWKPIISAAQKALAYIAKWTSEQPLAYQKAINPPGTVSAATQLQNFEATYRLAKTPAAKHAAWVSFWEWAGSYPNPEADGGAVIGVVDQAYIDAHEPLLEKQMRILEAELDNTPSLKGSEQLSADMANLMMQSALDIPLNYNETIYLQRPDLTGVQPDPYYGGSPYQYQYLNLK